jgi:hypothetical protein
MTDSEGPPQTTLRPGFYIGPWNDDYQTRWLLLYVNRNFEAITYDAAEVSELCVFKLRGDTVGFITGQLPFWQTGDRFTFSFLGTLTPTGLGGVLLMKGAPYNGRAFSTQFQFFPIDSSVSAADTALEGLYASVRMHQESGDLLGDELLLAKTSHGFAAFYTDYGGVPVGPYPSDTLSMHGDTVAMAAPVFGPDRLVSRTFILHPRNYPFAPDTGGSDSSHKAINLGKKASLSELFGVSNSHRCAPQEPGKNG